MIGMVFHNEEIARTAKAKAKVAAKGPIHP
jgi:hypothetical protein